jgi:hypothetical protein
MDNCSYTLALIDGIEEQRHLTIMEKKLQKNHQEALDKTTGGKENLLEKKS